MSRYEPRPVNASVRPWAVIDCMSKFGEKVVCGNLDERDARDMSKDLNRIWFGRRTTKTDGESA